MTKEVWGDFGKVWAEEGPVDEDDSDIRRWTTECPFMKLEVAELKDGGWLAYLHDVEVETELGAKDADDAKRLALEWLSDLLSYGVNQLRGENRELRFKQISTSTFKGTKPQESQVMIVYGLTESGEVYRSTGSSRWKRMEMKEAKSE